MRTPFRDLEGNFSYNSGFVTYYEDCEEFDTSNVDLDQDLVDFDNSLIDDFMWDLDERISFAIKKKIQV